MQTKSRKTQKLVLVMSGVAVLLAAANMLYIKEQSPQMSIAVSVCLIVFSLMLMLLSRVQEEKREYVEQDPMWVLCTDRLPTISGQGESTLFIVTRRGQVGCNVLRYFGNGQWCDDCGGVYRDVVAWRFMPTVYDLRTRISETAQAEMRGTRTAAPVQMDLR